MDGFSYRGIHCEELGVWYAPDPSSRWEQSPEFEVYDSESSTADGGLYQGNRVKKRVFTLACYYDSISVTTREKIRRWLDRNTYGELVFDSRPFEYYMVRPTKVVAGKQYLDSGYINEDVHSGPLTTTFTAYWPFGFMKYKSFEDADIDGAGAYCPIVADADMPALPTTASRTFYLYNCGTEVCDTKFSLKGTAATGLTITNVTNGTKCVLNSLPSDKTLYIDSFVGKVWTSADEVDYTYHNDGFIKLDPNYMDNVTVSTTHGTMNVEVLGQTVDDSWIGRRIYLDNEGGWCRVVGIVSDSVVEINVVATHTSTVITRMMTTNKIQITGNNLTFTTLEVDYTPYLTI